MKTENEIKSGIYIHIPFCTSRCFYCDFFSKVVTNENIKRNYSKAVTIELKRRLPELDGTTVSSVYIGGGSPSLMDSSFFAGLSEIFTMSGIDLDRVEYTVEVNLNDIDCKWISNLRMTGVNRVSAGIQAYDDTVLKEIGRRTTVEDIKKNLPILNSYFKNLSIDLIYGFGKNRNITNELDELFAIVDPVHISAYQYTPPHTKNAPVLLDEEITALQEAEIKDFLKNKDFTRYEISNYAKKGFESVHNSIYWQMGSWLGIGAGAKSFNSIKREHGFYDENINSFINGEGSSRYTSTFREQIEEFLLMGLRMTEGIEIKRLERYFNSDIDLIIDPSVINELTDEGLIEKKDGYLRCSEKGLDFLNPVLLKLFDSIKAG
ncbi:MAG TPA: coproporphyrinogen-III oxidase family protein [bacterium]|nr:coproporphyrinogen-III oxidase family protein [bacterium]